MQLATYVGWRLHGWRGGLVAGLLFVIAGALVVLGLSMIYAAFGNLPLVSAMFLGVKAAVLAIVVEALPRISRRSLRDGLEWLIAAAAFVGLLGALVTLWATFAPCFLWIFVGAPFVEHLNRAPRLSAALAGVTAAVVGVILNLTVWFAIHVLFAQIAEMHVGPLRLLVPTLASVSWISLLLSLLAVLLLFVWHAGIIRTLGLCAALGAAAHVATSASLL